MSTAVLNRAFNRTTILTPVLPPRSSVTPAATGRQPKKGAWKTLTGLTSVVLLISASVALEPWKTMSSHSVQAATHPSTAPHDTARTVAIDRPVRASTASIVLPATIRPWQTTTLHARVSGYLAAWHRDLGAPVKAGEILAEIETPEIDQELAEAKSLVREAVAAANQAKAERVEAEADLKVAEAQLVRIQAETELSRGQLSRREKLLEKNVIGQEEYDTFSTQLQTRTAEVAATESDISRRRTNLQTRTAIIQARDATVKSRQSNVDRLQELQTFKRIVAPFDGVVTHRSAEVGMLVTAGKESLFTIEDMSRVRVQINVPQAYSVQTSPGVAVTISIPESAAHAVSGTITRISQSVDAANRTMLAEIELQNAVTRFQPGSYAQVTLTTSQNSSEWTIPTNTLSMRVDGTHVAVVNPQNQIELKRVKLGRDLGRSIVVVDGIHGNESLVVNPSDDLTDGVRIQVRGNEPQRNVAKR